LEKLIKFLGFYFSLSSFLKKGIKKIKHAKRKKRLPNNAQKLPMLDIVKPIADTINIIHPKKFIFLLLIFFN
tara:strand:+ start:330 stop:545 length:216 start_codon:yes stop_codon:yes gene_type:complete